MAAEPRRTCVACRQEAAPEDLIRWVRGDDGKVYPDLSGRSFGRGAWIHPQRKCLARLSKGLSSSFRAPVTTGTEEALQLLGQAANHRVLQLLGAARRQNLVVAGTDAVGEAYERGEATHLLLAVDARSAAKSRYVAEAVRGGRAAAWGTKASLGQVLGRAEVGILAVRDRGLARRLFGAIAMALLARNEPVEGPVQVGSEFLE